MKRRAEVTKKGSGRYRQPWSRAKLETRILQSDGFQIRYYEPGATQPQAVFNLRDVDELAPSTVHDSTSPPLGVYLIRPLGVCNRDVGNSGGWGLRTP